MFDYLVCPNNDRWHCDIVRTVTIMAGKAPVDTECHALLNTAHVYSENQDTFDCMLNQVCDCAYIRYELVVNLIDSDQCWQ
jgi:hypothetical protein